MNNAGFVREKRKMDDFSEGKERFLDLLKQVDPAVTAVIPSAPSNGHFLISLTKGHSRKFMSLSEDDLIDLPADHTIMKEVEEEIKEHIAAMK